MPLYTMFMSTTTVLSGDRIVYTDFAEAIAAAQRTLRHVGGIVYESTVHYPNTYHWIVGRLNSFNGEAHYVGECVVMELQTKP